jgi:hypothetical protein
MVYHKMQEAANPCLKARGMRRLRLQKLGRIPSRYKFVYNNVIT